MKRITLAALAALGLLTGPRLARADMEQPFVPSDHTAQPWEEGHTVMQTGMGEFVGNAALPGGKRLLIVQPKTTTQVFVVGSTKVLDANGQELPRSALTDGDRIKVDFDVIGNTLIARRVTVLAPPEPLPAP